VVGLEVREEELPIPSPSIPACSKRMRQASRAGDAATQARVRRMRVHSDAAELKADAAAESSVATSIVSRNLRQTIGRSAADRMAADTHKTFANMH
jgi:hypothetical protein